MADYCPNVGRSMYKRYKWVKKKLEVRYPMVECIQVDKFLWASQTVDV